MPILELRKWYLGEQAWSLMLPCGHGTLWPVCSLPHAGETWGQRPGGNQSSLWVGSGLGGQSGVAVGRASGGGNDPGLPCCSSRPDGDSSLHPDAEPHMHLQARLVLHPETAGGVPAVPATEQVPPRLRRGQTRYGTGAGRPWGLPWDSPSWALALQPRPRTLSVVAQCPLPMDPPVPHSFFLPAHLIRHLLCARPWGIQRWLS